MQAAFYKACAVLGLSPTPDRLTEILVTKIIDLCLAGECDFDRLSEIVVAYFRTGEPRPEMAEDPAKFIEYARACREMVAREFSLSVGFAPRLCLWARRRWQCSSAQSEIPRRLYNSPSVRSASCFEVTPSHPLE
jgi:hypothetical protein